MIRVSKSAVIRQLLTEIELESLVRDFKIYKSEGVLPDLFGRDVLYDHPNTMPIVKHEAVQHIHLADADNPWPLHAIQFSKTSDSHLIYCQGASDLNSYALITILSPNAHEQTKSNSIMYRLGVIAGQFRNKY